MMNAMRQSIKITFSASSDSRSTYAVAKSSFVFVMLCLSKFSPALIPTIYKNSSASYLCAFVVGEYFKKMWLLLYKHMHSSFIQQFNKQN